MRKRSGYSRSCQFEALENRRLLAGDVTVQLVNGNLNIRGDNGDNEIEIVSAGGQLTVTGVGTSINGNPTTPFTTSNFTGRIRLNMRGGSDSVEITDVTSRGIDANLGSGDNTLILDGNIVNGETEIEGDDGDDTVSIVDSTFERSVEVELEGGDNDYTVTGSTFNRDAEFEGGSGADTAAFDDVSFARSVEVELGRGSNTLDFTNADVDDEGEFEGGSGVDDFTFDNATFRRLEVEQGRGDDILSISDTTVTERTRLDGGSGDNTFNNGPNNSLANLRARNYDTTVEVPSLSITGPSSINEGATYTLNLSATGPDSSSITQWTITWGDGDVDTVSGNPSTATHIYDDGPNNYTISATATNAAGTFNASNTVAVRVDNVAPQNVNAGPDVPNHPEGSPVTLNGTFTDPAGANDTYTQTWSVSSTNGQVIANGSGPSFTFTPNDNGTYTVTYTVTDGESAPVSDTATVTVINVAPQNVNAGPDVTNHPEGSPVTLNGTFTDPAGANDTYTQTWSVSSTNGQVIANGSGPSFTFTPNDNGTYTVTYTVTDGESAPVSDTATVTVINVAPQNVNAGPDVTNHPEGSPVTLNGTFTDPAGANDTYTQTWSVSSTNGQVIANGSGPSFTFTPNDNGTYTVTYTVTDGDGGSVSDTAVVTVNNVSPQNVNAGPDQTNRPEGSPVTLNGTFTDPAGANDTYTQTWSVVASNGQVIANGSGPSFTFTPNDNGTYTVTYTVTDGESAPVSDTATVTVINVAPQNVNAGPDVTNHPEGSPVTLNGTFTDPAGANDTYTQTWSVSSTNGQVIANGSGPSFTFTPNDNGTYTVTYTVTDGESAPVSDTATVTVINVAPQNVNAGPDVTNHPEGSPVTLNGTFTDPAGANDTYTQTWSVSSTNGQVIANGSGPSFTFTPNDNGTYTVTYTVTDGESAPVSDTATVTVINVAPSVTNLNTPSATEGSPATLTGTFTDIGVRDTHTLTVNWGDPNSLDSQFSISATNTPLAMGNTFTSTGDNGTDTTTVLTITSVNQNTGAVGFSVEHTYPDQGDYSVGVTVTDDDTGSSGTVSTTATINNDPPALSDPQPPTQTITEGNVATLTTMIDDDGTLDEFSVQVNWGDGTIVTAGALFFDGDTGGTLGSSTYAWTGATKTLVLTHRYADDPAGVANNYTVTLDVEDGTDSGAQQTATVTVNNAAPTITLTDPTDPSGTAFTLAGFFKDPGRPDTQTLVIAWGDTTFSTFLIPGNVTATTTVTSFAGAASTLTIGTVTTDPTSADFGKVEFTATHTYTVGGPYTITATIQDDDSGGPGTDTTTAFSIA